MMYPIFIKFIFFLEVKRFDSIRVDAYDVQLLGFELYYSL